MAEHEEEQKLKLTKKMVAEAMKEIDLCMMTTVGQYGHLHSRPMSNNREVEWDGDTWFFARADSSQARQIGRNPNVNLAYGQPDDILFISVLGKGEIVDDVAKKKELWYDELERWFPDGPEDDNIVLIKVVAHTAAVWSKEGDGELKL